MTNWGPRAMTRDSIRTLTKRVEKLEVRYRPVVEALERALDPFSIEMVVLRLAAGEWECALKLLDRQECEVCRSRPLRPSVFDLTNPDSLFEQATKGCEHLPDETKYLIARRLFESDREAACEREQARSPHASRGCRA